MLRALDLYFQVVAVQAGMQESVRTRCLTSLELESLPPLTAPVPLRGWQVLRVDRFIERQQYRRRFEEKTVQLARMVGARAAEAVIATHVENVIGFYELLRGVMPPVDQVTDHYLREFSLQSSAAQMVWQRVQARVAGEELTAQYSDPPRLLWMPRLPSPIPNPNPSTIRCLLRSRPLTPRRWVSWKKRRSELEAHTQIDVRRGEVADRVAIAGPDVAHLEAHHSRQLPPGDVPLHRDVAEPRSLRPDPRQRDHRSRRRPRPPTVAWAAR